MLAGIDLGGTSIKLGLATDDGDVLHRESFPTHGEEGPARVIDRIVERLRDAMQRAAATDRTNPLCGIGIGVPGLVDIDRGITRFLPNLPTQWRDVPLATILGEAFQCPIRVLNDARCATLGESRFGAGRDVQTMILLTLGTGVGGGIVIDGRLRLGALGAAGELGHQTILPDGPRCGCGNRGCLETLASGTALIAEGIRLMRSGLAPNLHRDCDGAADRVTPSLMANAADRGDEAIAEAIQRVGNWLGIGIANTVTAIHPQRVLLAGGVAGLGDRLIQPIIQTLRDRVRMFPTDTIDVRRAALGDDAGWMGAIALAAPSFTWQPSLTP
jgi:glucokinase